MENPKEKGIFVRIYEWFKNLTVKGLLGAIFVAIIIVIILFSVSYIPNIVSRISSSLSAALYSVFVPAEGATLTSDKKIVNSGEDFNVIFKKGDVTNGLFTISYTCDSNADLMSVESAGLKKITCDTPYYLLDNDTSIKLRANTGDSVVRLVIEGSVENNETQKIESVGVVRMTIKNDAIGTVVTPPVKTTGNTTVGTNTTAPTYVAPAIQPVYYGKPDLAVRILQTGLLNSGTNLIINNQNQFTAQDMVGIKFEIRNDGDANTGAWSFTASLPSISTPIYNSPTQVSLRPGESIIFTLGFSNLTNTYSNVITVTADSLNTVSESNESNNSIISTITNTSYNTNYYNNNNYNYNNYSNYNNNVNTGCYVNGYFTYNCTNYNNNYNYNNGWDYNYDYNNDYNDLRVTCYASPSNPDTGDRVRWYADAEGGDGDYDYEWDGTNGLDSSSENPTKTYSSRGVKYATVTVTDGDHNETSATCSIYVD